MIKTAILLSAIFCCAFQNPVPACGQEWASLKGRFVFEGEIPKQKTVTLPRLQNTPALKIPDERLLIDKETKGIANILVFAAHELSGEKTPMPVHSEARLPKVPEHKVLSEQFGINPRISYMHTAQQLMVLNPTNLPQVIESRSMLKKNERKSHTVRPGRFITRKSTEPTLAPFFFGHGPNPALGGWVLARDNNYVDITNSKGEFEIANLPLGTWNFVAWIELCAEKPSVKLQAKEEVWVNGQFTATIDKRGTDLGVIAVSADNFK